MNTITFLQKAKENAQAKAKQMAALELSIWNSTHESELKNHFGFNDQSLAARKKQLIQKSK